MSVKMAEFAPMPSASDRIATIVKSGLRRSPRKAKRRSRGGCSSPYLDGNGPRTVYGRRAHPSPPHRKKTSTAEHAEAAEQFFGFSACSADPCCPCDP